VENVNVLNCGIIYTPQFGVSKMFVFLFFEINQYFYSARTQSKVTLRLFKLLQNYYSSKNPNKKVAEFAQKYYAAKLFNRKFS